MRRWDWGDFSTSFAEDALLNQAANSGEFIVRRSKKLKGYCISVLVSTEEVRHFPLVEDAEGWLTIGAEMTQKGSPPQVPKQLAAKKFGTVPELVHFLVSPGRAAKRVFGHFGCFLTKPLPNAASSAAPAMVEAVVRAQSGFGAGAAAAAAGGRDSRGRGRGQRGSREGSEPPQSPKTTNFARARFNSSDFVGTQMSGSKRGRGRGPPALPADHRGIRGAKGRNPNNSFSVGDVRMRHRSPSAASAIRARATSLLPGMAMGEQDQAAFDAERRAKAQARREAAAALAKEAAVASDDGDDGDTSSISSSLSRRHSFSESDGHTARRRRSGYANVMPDGSPIGDGPIPDDHFYEYQNWQSIKRREAGEIAKQLANMHDAEAVSGEAHSAEQTLYTNMALHDPTPPDESPYKNSGFSDADETAPVIASENPYARGFDDEADEAAAAEGAVGGDVAQTASAELDDSDADDGNDGDFNVSAATADNMVSADGEYGTLTHASADDRARDDEIVEMAWRDGFDDSMGGFGEDEAC